MRSIAERINIVGVGSSIAGLLALITFYGSKTAYGISDVILAEQSQELFAEISNYSMLAGTSLFGLGLVLSGGSSIARRYEIEKKDVILAVGVPALGILLLLGDFFLLIN